MTGQDMYSWVPQDCPICEVPPSKYLGRRGGAAHRQNLGIECQVWSCGKCGLIFPNPMPVPIGGLEQHYAVRPEDYFHHHEESDRLQYASMLMQQLRELKIKKGMLLDIGAGRGELLRVAREDGWTAVGIETSPDFAEYAARYSQAEVIQKPLQECRFNKNTFDAVVLGAVLEHLYNPAEVIQEIARILKPGGALFVDVPNERGLYFIAGNLYYRFRLRDWVVNLAPTFSPYHVFGFTPGSLKKLLGKNGLHPVIWYVFSGRSLVPDRGGLVGYLEQQAAKLVTFISKRGELGEYIATWAIKDES
jgi:SAM-dependent methyltransferase